MHPNIDDFKTSKELGCERRDGHASRGRKGQSDPFLKTSYNTSKFLEIS